MALGGLFSKDPYRDSHTGKGVTRPVIDDTVFKENNKGGDPSEVTINGSAPSVGNPYGSGSSGKK